MILGALYERRAPVMLTVYGSSVTQSHVVGKHAVAQARYADDGSPAFFIDEKLAPRGTHVFNLSARQEDWVPITTNDGSIEGMQGARWIAGRFRLEWPQYQAFARAYLGVAAPHVYLLGDSNLALHQGLTAAGIAGGIGALKDADGKATGWFGWNLPMPGTPERKDLTNRVAALAQYYLITADPRSAHGEVMAEIARRSRVRKT